MPSASIRCLIRFVAKSIGFDFAVDVVVDSVEPLPHEAKRTKAKRMY